MKTEDKNQNSQIAEPVTDSDEPVFLYEANQAYFPPESLDDFSTTPIEFEEAAQKMGEDMWLMFNMTAA